MPVVDIGPVVMLAPGGKCCQKAHKVLESVHEVFLLE
jgi:hypothetical protein